jgi:hypothetical protein
MVAWNAREEASSSFLKKRTKKLLRPDAMLENNALKLKVFCFFFSKKKCFLKP